MFLSSSVSCQQTPRAATASATSTSYAAVSSLPPSSSSTSSTGSATSILSKKSTSTRRKSTPLKRYSVKIVVVFCRCRLAVFIDTRVVELDKFCIVDDVEQLEVLDVYSYLSNRLERTIFEKAFEISIALWFAFWGKLC